MVFLGRISSARRYVFMPMNEVTLLLEAIGRGEKAASEELLPLVYDELRHLAASRMRGESGVQTLQPTALVHEAWLRLVSDEDRTWNDRAHFFRVAALAMRRILVDRARQKATVKRGEGFERLNIEDLELCETTPDDRILMIDEALSRLEKNDPEGARIVTLKFFGGFTNREIAQTLDISERTVERLWAHARVSLFRMIQEGEAHESA
jgi:RNA polymerase sigma factor (TIGR02999 family)